MNQLYLVTGAAGHLGSTLIETLQKQGKKIRMFLLPSESDFAKRYPHIPAVYGNVCDVQSLEAFFQNTEGSKVHVIHAAGIVSIASKFNQKVYDVNVNGTKNVIHLCEKYRVHKLVYVSSVHALPETAGNDIIHESSSFAPDQVVGLYAQTKSEATAAVLESAKRGLNASVVHPSGIIGPNDSGHGHLTQLVIDYVKGALHAIIHGGYDFVDVRDVAEGIVSCCEKGAAGECYILSNQYYEVSGLLKTLYTVCKSLPVITAKKKPREIKTILPVWFAKTTAPLAELYYKIRRRPPLYTPYSLYTLFSNSRFTHAKADAHLQYQTRPLEATLTDTVLWLNAHNRI